MTVNVYAIVAGRVFVEERRFTKWYWWGDRQSSTEESGWCRGWYQATGFAIMQWRSCYRNVIISGVSPPPPPPFPVLVIISATVPTPARPTTHWKLRFFLKL